MKVKISLLFIILCLVLTGCSLPDFTSSDTKATSVNANKTEEYKNLAEAQQRITNLKERLSEIEKQQPKGLLQNAWKNSAVGTAIDKLTGTPTAQHLRKERKSAEKELEKAEAAYREASENYAGATGHTVTQTGFKVKETVSQYGLYVCGIIGIIVLLILLFTKNKKVKCNSVKEDEATQTADVTKTMDYDTNSQLSKVCRKAGISPKQAVSAVGGDMQSAVIYATMLSQGKKAEASAFAKRERGGE